MIDSGLVASPLDAHTACVDMRDNSFQAGGQTDVTVGSDVAISQRQATTMQLPGYTGPNDADALVLAFLTGQNSTTPPTTVYPTDDVSQGGGGYTDGTCTLPPTPPLVP